MNQITKETKQEAIEDLTAMADQIYEIMEMMKSTIQEVAPAEVARAEGYWLAHIDGALDGRNGNFHGSMFNLADVIETLEEEDEEYDS